MGASTLKKLTKNQIRNRMKLVKALYSGKFKQATGQLADYDINDVGVHTPLAFCCLGVACVVAGIEKPDGDVLGDVQDLSKSNNTIKTARARGKFVRGYFGFDSTNGIEFGFDSDDKFAEYIDLAMLNDSSDYTFDDIADVIHLDTLMRS